jgi:hypothetical protein
MSKNKSLERNMIKNLQATMAKSKAKQAERIEKRKATKKVKLEPKVEVKYTKPIDLEYARRYSIKAKNAHEFGHEFTLTFAQFKRLFNRKYCQLSGVKLITSDSNSPYYPTLDRLDNLKGYIQGNVVCCAHFVNQFKSVIENPNNSMTVELATKTLNNINKFMKKGRQ